MPHALKFVRYRTYELCISQDAGSNVSESKIWHRWGWFQKHCTLIDQFDKLIGNNSILNYPTYAPTVIAAQSSILLHFICFQLDHMPHALATIMLCSTWLHNDTFGTSSFAHALYFLFILGKLTKNYGCKSTAAIILLDIILVTSVQFLSLLHRPSRPTCLVDTSLLLPFLNHGVPFRNFS